MISICLNTRERPTLFKRLCESALDTAKDPNDLEFVSYHDHDDTTIYSYLGNHTEITGENLAYPNEMLNKCFEVARGDLFCAYISDEAVFKTKGWDARVIDAFDFIEDRIALVCPNNKDWNTWSFSTVGFLHRNWFNAVGHFAPTVDGAQSIDRWYHDLSISLNRHVKLMDVIVEHEHVRDTVHDRKNRLGRFERWTRKYRSKEVIAQRNADFQLLTKFINEVCYGRN